MLRLGFVFLLFGLVAATQAAQPEDDFAAPGLNLISTNFVQPNAKFLPRYQLRASVALVPSPDIDPIAAWSPPLPQLPPANRQDTHHAIHYQQAYESDHFSLPRLLRVELTGQQTSIAFRPHSVLIEKESLKIRLQPHSASMLWVKSF